jgi:hypothetical protein
MSKISGGSILTDKKALKPSARETIVSAVMPMLAENLPSFERVADKNIVTMPFEDEFGNIAYATLTLTVSTLNPNERKEKAPKKKVAKPTESFSVNE